MLEAATKEFCCCKNYQKIIFEFARDRRYCIEKIVDTVTAETEES